MAPPSKRLKRALVSGLARAILTVIGALPEALALPLGGALGRLAGALAGPARRLATAQAEKAGAEPGVVPAMFEHLGRLLAELALLSTDPRRVGRWASWPEPDALAAALTEGRGAIVLSAHLGNWELLAARAVLAGHRVAAFARENVNPAVDRWIVDLRARLGVETLHRGGEGSARRALEVLRSGGVLALLVDQDTRADSVVAPFFGRPARTPRGALELAIRRRVPVVVALTWREGRAHRVTLERLAIPAWRRGEPLEAAVLELATETNRRLERAIAAHASQWPWLHARWRRAEAAS